jgi:hypothetical protein
VSNPRSPAVRTCVNEAWCFSPKEVATHFNVKRRVPEPNRSPEYAQRRLQEANNAAGCYLGKEYDRYGRKHPDVYPGGTPYKVQPSVFTSKDMACCMGWLDLNSANDSRNMPEISRRCITSLSEDMCHAMGASSTSQHAGKNGLSPWEGDRFMQPVPRRALSEDVRSGATASQASFTSQSSFSVGRTLPSASCPSRTAPGEVSMPPSEAFISSERPRSSAGGPSLRLKHGQVNASRHSAKSGGGTLSSRSSIASASSEQSFTTSYASRCRSALSNRGSLSAR